MEEKRYAVRMKIDFIETNDSGGLKTTDDAWGKSLEQWNTVHGPVRSGSTLREFQAGVFYDLVCSVAEDMQDQLKTISSLEAKP